MSRVSTDWETLLRLIVEYGDACRADEVKGGTGDPADVEIRTAELAVALAKVELHIERMRREAA